MLYEEIPAELKGFSRPWLLRLSNTSESLNPHFTEGSYRVHLDIAVYSGVFPCGAT
jgi:hypothetical protein